MPQISLAAARINAGLTQEKVAKIIGKSIKTVSSYENGRTPIPMHIFRKLSNLYHVPTDFIRLPIVDDGNTDELM
ncbi:helix-turn-helix domain-containing protein [Globicatella sulfidifaciens]